MIPLRDVLRSRTTPVMVYSLIAANIGVFLFELTLNGPALKQFLYSMGVVPIFLSDPSVWQLRTPLEQLLPLVTSMFIHGGWLHIIGNLWFLNIFGDNVEDRMGHGRFLTFFLLSGIVSVGIHVLTNWGSSMPVVGASGAISGVMGAYLIFYPKARVVTLIPIFLFFTIITIPAYFFLLFWLFLQFFNGAFSLMDVSAGEGIAWWAHIGGFVFGMLFAKVFVRPSAKRPQLTIVAD
jgi:membrane associated rhomboid family serine protease